MSTYAIATRDVREGTGPHFTVQQSTLPIKDNKMMQWLGKMYGFLDHSIPKDVNLSHTGRMISDQSVGLFEMFSGIADDLVHSIELKPFTTNDAILHIFPVKDVTNKERVRWSSTKFHVEFLDEIAPHGRMRGMKYETSEGETTLAMLGIKFGIDDRIMETENGEVLFRNFSAAVERSIEETEKAGTIFHILKTPREVGFYSPTSDSIFAKTGGWRGVYKRDLRRFLIAQRDSQPIHTIDTEFDDDFATRNVTDTRVMILDTRILRILHERNPNYVQFWQTGRSAARALDKAADKTRRDFRDKTVYDVEEFQIEGSAPINMFKRHVLMGEMMILHNRGKGTDYSTYSSKDYDVEAYDVHEGKWVRVFGNEGISNSLRFNQKTGDPNVSHNIATWADPSMNIKNLQLKEDWLEYTPTSRPGVLRAAPVWGCVNVKSLSKTSATRQMDALFYLDLANSPIAKLKANNKLGAIEKGYEQYMEIVRRMESAKGWTPEKKADILAYFAALAAANKDVENDPRLEGCTDGASNVKLDSQGSLNLEEVGAPSRTAFNGNHLPPGLYSFSTLRGLAGGAIDGFTAEQLDKDIVRKTVDRLRSFGDLVTDMFPSSLLLSHSYVGPWWDRAHRTDLALQNLLPQRLPGFFGRFEVQSGDDAGEDAARTQATVNAQKVVVQGLGLNFTTKDDEYLLLANFIRLARLNTTDDTGKQALKEALSNVGVISEERLAGNWTVRDFSLNKKELISRLVSAYADPSLSRLRSERSPSAESLREALDKAQTKIDELGPARASTVLRIVDLDPSNTRRAPVFLGPEQLAAYYNIANVAKTQLSFVPADPYDFSRPITLEHWKELANPTRNTPEELRTYAVPLKDNYIRRLDGRLSFGPVANVEVVRRQRGATSVRPTYAAVSSDTTPHSIVGGDFNAGLVARQYFNETLGVAQASDARTEARDLLAPQFDEGLPQAAIEDPTQYSDTTFTADGSFNASNFGACFDLEIAEILDSPFLKLWNEIAFHASSPLHAFFAHLYITSSTNMKKSLLHWYRIGLALPATTWVFRRLQLYALTIVSMVEGEKTGVRLRGNPFAPVQSSGFLHESDYGFVYRFGIAIYKPENIDRIDAAFGAGYIGGQSCNWRNVHKHRQDPDSVDDHSVDSNGDLISIVVPGSIVAPPCGYPISLTGYLGILSGNNASLQVPFPGLHHHMLAYGRGEMQQRMDTTDPTGLLGELHTQEDLVTPYWRAPIKEYNAVQGQYVKADDGNGWFGFDVYDSGIAQKVYDGTSMALPPTIVRVGA